LISIKVLNKAGPEEWAAEYRGSSIRIKTTASLTNGTVYTGFLSRKNGVIRFTLKQDVPRTPAASIRAPGGVPAPGSAGFSRHILLNAFAHSAQNLPPPERLTHLARLIEKTSLRESRKRAALIVRCEEKGIDLEKKAFDGLFSSLEGAFNDTEGEPDKEKNKKPASKENFPVEAAEEGGPDNSILLLFNHLSGTEDVWLIIPYKCYADDLAYCGSLRICYNRKKNNWSKAVLSVRNESRGPDWFFSWHLIDRTIPLRVYTEDPLGADFPAEMAQKLRKLGLRIDDIIYSEEKFNGFEEAKEFMNFIDETV
jgi:hypothetical protein